MKKRLLSFLLCLAILAGQIPAAAFAAEDTPLTEPAAAETTLAEQKDATETPAPAAEEEPETPKAPETQQPAPTGEAAPEQTPDQQPTQQPETEGSKGAEAAPTPEGQPVPPPENVTDQGEAQPEQQPAEGAGPADANSEETEEQPGDSVVTYTITFTDELGTASDETGSEITQAAEGTLVTITAKDRAEEGLLFTAWQAPEGLELADDTEEITTFTMPDSNVELAAEYAPLPEDAEALAEEEEIMLADASPVTGDGTEGNPYQVSTYEQLKTAVDKGDAKVKLVADIDTTNENGGAGVTKQTALTFIGDGNILDLNGHTLKLVSDTGVIFFEVLKGLTIKDSGTGGRIDFEYGSNVIYRTTAIHVAPSAGAKLTVESGTLSSTYDGVTLIESEGNLTIKGGKLEMPIAYDGVTPQTIHTFNSYGDGCKILISGGEIYGTTVFTRDDSSVEKFPQDGDYPIQITGGTMKGRVIPVWIKGGEPTNQTEYSPVIEITGGVIHNWGRTGFMASCKRLPTKVVEGSFKDGAIISVGDVKKTSEICVAALGQSAIRYNDEYGPSSQVCRGNGIPGGTVNDGGIAIYTNEDNPVTVIPNAWGIKSVKLDGKEISYAKDWNGEPIEIDNSKEHILTYEWYPLLDGLQKCGYKYDAMFQRYYAGDDGGHGEIITSGTQYSYTIKKGIEPKLYTFNLALDMLHNGKSFLNGHNNHAVKLMVKEAPPVLDTFISTVRFDLQKTEVGEPGELSFTATDVNGNTVAINPDVRWDPTNIKEGENHVSFKIPAPTGYTFVDETGKVTTLLLSGEKVIGNVSSDGALNYSFTCQVDHKHKAATVGYNAKYHWDVCSCGQKIMNTSAKHTMGAWEKTKDILGGGEEYTRTCTHTGCGYTETTVDYSGVKHVTSLVLNMKNYPMDGMRPHNFVKNGSETPKDSEGEYLLTERDSSILYPSFSITSGNDKAKLYTMNPEAYDIPADNPDFAKWSYRGSLLAPECDDTGHDTHSDKSTFTTGRNYGVRLFLEAKDGYAFYKDFNDANNFKLYTDMNGIEVKTYRVEAWYYKNTEGVDDWNSQAPADDSAGASKVRVLFQLTAKNEGDLNITLPELKAGDDLKAVWAHFEGTPNFGTDDFVKDCYNTTTQTMQWTDGPSCVIRNNSVTGESVTAQAGNTYTLTIPAVNENVLAHITIKNPEAATKVIENADGTITVTYTLPAAADNKIVHGAAISVTAPAYGKAPSTTAAITAGDNCTASAVTWNPADAAFEAKAYTATVTLTPSTDYTFANDAAFTINGHVVAATKNADGSVTLSYTFPALAAPHTHDYTNQPYVYMTPGNHYQECKAHDGAYNIEAHDFSAWENNGDGTHSRHCNVCKKSGEIANYTETATHNWQWVVDTVATPNAAGKKHEECTDCGIKQNENTEIPMMTSIKVENLTIAKPAKGAAAEAATTTDSAYTVANTQWKAADGTILAVGEKFKPGTVYTASITLQSNSDAVFSAKSTFNAIDGKSAAVAGGALTGDSYAYSIVLTYTFDATEGVHQHTYGAWSNDETHHWHECTDASCPGKAASVIDKAEHNFEWKIDVPASQASTGTKHEECTVCGKKRNEGTVIDKLPGSSSGSHHSSSNNSNNNTGTEAAAPAPAASAPVTTTTSARTGDSSNLIGWLAVLLISGGAAGAWYTVAKKKKEQ